MGIPATVAGFKDGRRLPCTKEHKEIGDSFQFPCEHWDPWSYNYKELNLTNNLLSRKWILSRALQKEHSLPTP
jgi:hypothetical protein